MGALKRINKQACGHGRTPDYPRLLGGVLCLDFANTVEGRLDPRPTDFIEGYADLPAWAFHAGLMDAQRRGRVLRLAKVEVATAERLYGRAIELREALYRTFRAVARGTTPDERDLAVAAREYAAGMAEASLEPGGTTWSWAWREDDLAYPVWAVARSAVDLLTSADLSRIKQCPGALDCGWLYYDASRNRTRRWCSMEGCGSRVKMRRQYARQTSRGLNCRGGAGT
jgi:predicted RNA-binding Zn ribbon-like protein